MDTVQFLFSVVNLLLAMSVLFGGRLIFQRLTELREDVEKLKSERPDSGHRDGSVSGKPLEWKE